MGCTSVVLLLLSLEERGLVEIGALQPPLGFKDFRRAARLHSLTNGQFGGEKQAGLRPPPRPQLQRSSSSGLRWVSALGRGGDVLQPCGGKANCCSLAEVQLSVLVPGGGRAARGPATPRSSSHRWLHREVAQHVIRREGGTRVLGWP
jgi:hypothetical protein